VKSQRHEHHDALLHGSAVVGVIFCWSTIDAPINSGVTYSDRGSRGPGSIQEGRPSHFVACDSIE